MRLAVGLEDDVVGRATIGLLADVGDVFETTGIGGNGIVHVAHLIDKGPCG